LLHDKVPPIDSFKVFGSLCYSTSLHSHRTKLDAKARKSVFLGYSVGFKGFVLLDIHTREIHISRHVSFYQHILPYPPSSSSVTTDWDYFPSDASTACNPSLSPPPTFIDIDPSPPDNAPSPSSLSPPPDLRRSSRIVNPPSHL
jgi:hypothetical protein